MESKHSGGQRIIGKRIVKALREILGACAQVWGLQAVRGIKRGANQFIHLRCLRGSFYIVQVREKQSDG